MNSPELQPSLLHRSSNVLMAGVLTVGAVGCATNNRLVANSKSTTEMTAAPPTPEQCADSLPLDFLVGQVLLVGIQADALSAQATTFKRYNIGGAVLMTSPANPYDGSIDRFKLAAGIPNDPVLISTDEEGGDVERIHFSSLPLLPSPQQVAETMSPAQAQQLLKQYGGQLKDVGVDMDLAPLADVAPVYGTSVLGNRIFSSNPQTVLTYDLAYERGLESGGIRPAAKHFPGMGPATANTDYGPATTSPLSSLEKRDFIPYKGLTKSGTTLMVGNQTVPGWFSGPASLAPVVYKYLRTTLGYSNNLIVTDSLTAGAVTAVAYESQAVFEAVRAGADMALIVEATNDAASNAELFAKIESGLEKAVSKGVLTKQQLALSLLRKLAVKHESACSLVEK
jgi:beta-N-acetylhexosaminidase